MFNFSRVNIALVNQLDFPLETSRGKRILFLRVWVDSFSSVRASGFIKVALKVILFLL